MSPNYVYEINAKPGEEDLLTRKLVSKVEELTHKKGKLSFTVDSEKISHWERIDLSKIYGYELAFTVGDVKLKYFRIHSLQCTPKEHSYLLSLDIQTL